MYFAQPSFCIFEWCGMYQKPQKLNLVFPNFSLKVKADIIRYCLIETVAIDEARMDHSFYFMV